MAANSEIFDQVNKKLQEAREQFVTAPPIPRPTVEELFIPIKFPESYHVPMYATLGPRFHEKNIPGEKRNRDHEKIFREKGKLINDLMVRTNEVNADRYTDAVLMHLETAHNLYARFPVILPDSDLVPILVIDGIFVCELLRNYRDYKLQTMARGIIDDVDQDDHMRIVQMDFLTNDNFVPVIILQELLKVSRDPTSTREGEGGDDIVSLTRIFFDGISPVGNLPASLDREVMLSGDIHHLLALVHVMISTYLGNGVATPSKLDDWNIPNATHLKKSCWIKVKVDSTSKNPFDVKFERSRLLMPRLEYYQVSVRILFFLKVYETIQNPPSRFAMDYIYILRCLVNSSEDVEHLEDAGIICRLIPGDPTVFDGIDVLAGGNSQGKPPNFRYEHIFRKAKEYCTPQVSLSHKLEYYF